MKPQARFQDDRREAMDFMGEILVVCPQCGDCAVVRAVSPPTAERFSERRVLCSHCGFQKQKQPSSVTVGNGLVDGFFGLPLWLVQGSGSEVLWAYNLNHLEYVETFVRATLRQRKPDDAGYANRSLISRLPRWIKKAGNRDRALHMIAKLKQKAERAVSR